MHRMSVLKRLVAATGTVLIAVCTLGPLAGCAGAMSGSSAPASRVDASRPRADASVTVQPQESALATVPVDVVQTCSACAGKGEAASVKGTPTIKAGVQVVRIGLKGGYYSPNTFRVKAGVPVTVIITGEATGCLATPRFKTLGKLASLASGTTTMKLGALAVGTYPLTCGMGVEGGKIIAFRATATSSSGSKPTTKATAKPKPKPAPKPAPAVSVQSIVFNNGAGSHQTLTAHANTPINVTFDPSTTGCAADIHFTAGKFVKTNAAGHDVTYHSKGLPVGTYHWKCSMEGCCFGTLTVK